MAVPDDFTDREAIESALTDEGLDAEAAERVAREIEAEAGHDLGDPAGLFEAVVDAAGMIADGALDLVSGVDVPAIDSKWVMLKSDADGHDWRTDAPILVEKDAETDQRIGYAPAMIPRELDKEGEVVSTPTVEKLAHDYLKTDGGIDTDHSLIDGDGEPVESWILKEQRTFDLPTGGEETYPAGTWMLGVEWTKDAWDRIKDGELTGLSIYGQAERVELGKGAALDALAKQDFGEWPFADGKDGLKECESEMAGEVENEFAFCRAWAAESGVDISAAVDKQIPVPEPDDAPIHVVYESEADAVAASEGLGLGGDVHTHDLDGTTVYMPGASHEAFVNAVAELVADSADAGETTKGGHGDMSIQDSHMSDESTTDGDSADSDGPTIESVASDVSTLADTVTEVSETVAELKDAVDTTAEQPDAPETVADALALADKEVDMDTLVDLMAELDDVDASADEIADTIAPLMRATDEDDDEDDEDMDASAKSEDANLEKGAGRTSEGVREATISDDAATSGLPSYEELAEQGGD